MNEELKHMDRVTADQVVDSSLKHYQLAQLEKAIDQALDSQDRDLFEELSRKYQQLQSEVD